MPVRIGGLGLALFDDEFVQDPYPLYERMHAAGPVHEVGDSGFYAVSGWDAINEVLARPDVFSSNLTATMMYQDGDVERFVVGELGGEIQALATADDPAHALHRRLLVPQLAARKINVLEDYIAEVAARLWEVGVHGGTIEWMSAMANRLPMMIVTRLIGLPDANVDQLVQWGCASTKVVEGLVDQDDLTTAGIAIMELLGYVTEHFQRAATDPQDDLLGALATARASGTISDATALTIMLTLFSAGGESTASLIGSAANLLASLPAVQERVRSDPHLIGPFLEEVLRFEPPFRGHYRHVLSDTVLYGHALPKDSRLVLLWASANRDPSHFDEPNEFLLDRPNAKTHIAFGKGAHFCVGAALARLEARIVLQDLVQRTSWIETVEVGRWLPSLLVRRLERLQLSLT